jgi:hypothetical protein
MIDLLLEKTLAAKDRSLDRKNRHLVATAQGLVAADTVLVLRQSEEIERLLIPCSQVLSCLDPGLKE